MVDKYIPYQKEYDELKEYRKYCRYMLCAICIMTILIPAVRYYKCAELQWFEFSYFVLLIFYFILNSYTELYLSPNAAMSRRKGYIDNSLGTKLLPTELRGYFTNDDVMQGAYKLAVNCYENCFFTYNIAKEMTKGLLLKNGFVLFLLLCSAYIGFKNSFVAIPILQVFLSNMFLLTLIHHFIFLNRLKTLLNFFEQFFYSNKRKDYDQGMPFYFALNYETTLAYNKAPLSDEIFKKLDEKLSKEWEEIKKRYDIQ